MEAANKVVLIGLKKKFEASQSSWVDELPQVLWSYHTTPQSSTHEIPLCLVYGVDDMIPFEIIEPMIRMTMFDENSSTNDCLAKLDTIEEVPEVAHIREVATNLRAV